MHESYIFPLRCYSEWCSILSRMLKSVNHIEIFLKMYCLAWNFSRVQKAVHTKVTTVLPRWLKNCRRSFTLSKILIGSCSSTFPICLKSSYSSSVWNLNFMIVFVCGKEKKEKSSYFSWSDSVLLSNRHNSCMRATTVDELWQTACNCPNYLACQIFFVDSDEQT